MFEQEIEKGIAFLDEKMPGWLELVDPERLDMNLADIVNNCGCVLAQIGAPDDSYYWLCEELGIENQDYLYGFSIKSTISDEYAWYMLTAEWQAKLRELNAERAS